MQQIGSLDLTIVKIELFIHLSSDISRSVFCHPTIFSCSDSSEVLASGASTMIPESQLEPVATLPDLEVPRNRIPETHSRLGTWSKGHWGPTASGKNVIWDYRSLSRIKDTFFLSLQLVFCFFSFINSQWYHRGNTTMTLCYTEHLVLRVRNMLYDPMGPGNLRHFLHTRGRCIILVSKTSRTLIR